MRLTSLALQELDHPLSYLLISPLTWALLGLLTLASVRGQRALRGLAWAVALLAITAMTPFGANLLLNPLETWARDTAQRCESPRSHTPTPTIVLAGGFQRDAHDASDISALTYSSYARSAYAARLYREGAVAHLYVSGGPHDGGVAEGTVMSTLLKQLGVDPARLTTEQQARDTWANATTLKAMLRPEDRTHPLRLITTAMHMRRAMLAFEAAGVAVCPAPTEWQHIPFSLSPGYFLPQRSSLDKAERVLHEWVGLAVYGLRER